LFDFQFSILYYISMSDIDFANYEPVSKDGAAYTKGLMEIWERLGRPDDCSTEAGWRMLDQIVNCWTVNFPHEVAGWQHDRQIDLDNEILLSDLVKKGGGYNPVTYAPRLFRLIVALLPNQKLTDKDFQRKLVARHGLFKSTNFKI